MNLKNKVVFITGSTHGIGAAMAVSFARKGAALILNGRSRQLPADLAEKLADLATPVKYLPADLTKTDLQTLTDQAWQAYGKIDILINNAGLNRDGLLIGMHAADFDQVIDLDLRVPFFLTKAVMKKMNKERAGVIINMASVVGLHGNLGQANYAAAKAGLIGFTKTAAREGALRHLRVNAIAPGMIATSMTAKLSDRRQKEIDKQIPLARLGRPAEVAQAAVFLAENDYMTGQTIVVDGGMTM